MEQLTFHRYPGEYRLYVSDQPPALSVAYYEISGDIVDGPTRWQITIQRPINYLMTAEHAHNFSEDMRYTAGDYATLREAREACQRHAEAEAKLYPITETVRIAALLGFASYVRPNKKASPWVLLWSSHASTYALSMDDLPFGGFSSQESTSGDEIAVWIDVPVGSAEHQAAINNSRIAQEVHA